MRVVHGPASAFYGDFNFGGVIEVSSPSDVTATSGQLGVSSYGDVTGWVRSGARGQKSGFFTSAYGEREEGWRDNSSYWLGSGSLRGWKQAGQGPAGGGRTALRQRLEVAGIPLGGAVQRGRPYHRHRHQ